MLAIRQIIEDPQDVIAIPPEFRHRRTEVDLVPARRVVTECRRAASCFMTLGFLNLTLARHNLHSHATRGNEIIHKEATA
ncbi:MAG: hypothetical protein ISR72_11475 [Methylobacter sp.]|nr:hypothetical protein [Methylobacter sp.]